MTCSFPRFVADVALRAITIRMTPNLSVTMPNFEAKKVLLSGMLDLAALADGVEQLLGLGVARLALSVSPKPWKDGLPAQWPSDARICVSPTLKAACMTLFPVLGGIVLGWLVRALP